MYDEKCLQNIGNNIKVMRVACRMQQRELAQHLNISQTHMSNIEGGRVCVSLKLLLRAANIFVCKVEALLNPEADDVRIEVEQASAADNMYSLEEVRLLLKIMQGVKK